MSNQDALNSGASTAGLPTWVASGVLGLVVGAAATFLTMSARGTPVASGGGNAPPTANAPAPTAGAPGGGMMGGGMMGGGGGMMGGMMGGGGGGGGGGKRALTAWVGKLELLSRPQLNLRVELTPEQVAKLSPLLAEAATAEKMTADDATELQTALEAVLTAEQNEALAAISLPFARGGGGGFGGFGGGGGGGGGRGPGGPGGPGGGPGGPGGGPGGPGGGPGGPGGGMMGGMMGGMGGGNPDENPFTQEVNKQRLEDLLARWKEQK